jgi:4-diphosphocytidyl-2-C-methyl-D-erythritol kinase
MDPTLSLISPAKLNLFLHINGRRGPDQSHPGYHELQTVFQILDRGDELQFSSNHRGQIEITPEIPDIPLEENLIYIAAYRLKEAALMLEKGSPNLGAKIHIEKNLPMGGGLGGGSSNAATTLVALNHLWNLNFDENHLSKIAAKIGADVPVFVEGYSAWAEGIGDELCPIQMSEEWFVVLTPNCHINTAKIFSHERLTRDTPKKKIAPALEGHGLETSAKKFLSDNYRNDFETLISELYPEIKEAIHWLSQFGIARLTGTGACCFCIVKDEATAKQVLNEAKSKFKGFIAKGVNLSPAIQRLDEAKRFARNHS